MKRTVEIIDSPNKKPRIVELPSSSSSSEEEGEPEPETLKVKEVPIDYSHKYLHVSYHWAMGDGSDDLNVLSALLDVTNMSVGTREHLRALLADETIVKSILCDINLGCGTMEMELTKEDREILEGAEWCAIPEEDDAEATNVTQIVSFVYIKGAY